MLGFYVAGFLLLGLALLGAWFWNAWTNWQFGEDEARRRQVEAARQLGVPVETAVDLGGGVALDLVLIPPGMFDMGSPDGEAGRSGDESPVHRVRIGRAFYVGKYEVTQEQWEKVMGANPSHCKGPKLPVECVSWDDCQEFLKRLNALVPNPVPTVVGAGLKPAPTGPRWAFRLPTEAEWEWACRPGTRTRFSFGDDDARLGEYAWYDANSGNTTHPVGEKQPNAWGLHDCHGNVWEWCADAWGSYSPNPWPGRFRWTRDPQGPATGSARVLRGGGWYGNPDGCRSATRGSGDPTDRFDGIGFRVVAAPVSAGP
jgi:formylglycine-generating enzyme required for sulfatase activity